ncbi:hypothetical protein [Vibrio phage vB_VpS_PG28]|nr:hypothetical protein [Vibrio phage vB_VpS_PG28]
MSIRYEKVEKASPLPELWLYRSKSDMQGTLGTLFTPSGNKIYTIELPWRDNQQSISSIPAGTYILEPWSSKKFGKCWHLKDVEGRSYILIHKGNVAGARDHGFKTHSEGCIIIGKSAGTLYGQKAVLNSGGAMAELQKELGHENEYIIHIVETMK